MLVSDASGNLIMAQDGQDGVWEVLLRCAKEQSSEAMFLKALQVAESHYGQDSVQVGSVCGEFAQYYRARGEDKAAEKYEERAEQILRKFVAERADVIDALRLNQMKKVED